MSTDRRDPEQLAAEYLALLDDGRPSELEIFLDQVPEEARAEFEDLVEAARAAEGALPRVLGPDTLLAGRYRIREEIGRGGMGKVFRATDEQLQRDVAVKVLAAVHAGDEDAQKLLIKESRLLATLQHPNIVSVHEAGADEDDLTFIVMELVDGSSLSSVIERARTKLQRRHGGQSVSPRDGALLTEAIGKPVPDGREDLIDERSWYASTARIVLEIARTLEAAHGQGVVHRDLKPNNVMLLGGGNPVVLDFGLAGSSTQKAGEVTQGLYGTVAYLAPEQARTQKVGTDPRTDVYQVGLILYELLTLNRAFPGEAVLTVLEDIQKGLFRAPRRVNRAVPRDLEAVCLKAMERSPERRYGTARELREDLERHLGGVEVPHAMKTDRYRSFVRQTRLFPRRRPLLAAGLGMVLVGALAVGAGYQFFAPDPRLEVDQAFTQGPDADDLPSPVSSFGGTVNVNDIMGVRVENPEPVAWVFALSVFGGGDPGTKRVAVMEPLLLENVSDGQAERDGRFDLRLGSGRQWVACSKVYDLPNDEYYEGLRVLLADDEATRDRYQRWMELIDSSDEAKSGISFRESERLLAMAGDPTRGGSLGRLSDEERERLSNLTAKILGQLEWEDDDLRPYEVECRVVAAGD